MELKRISSLLVRKRTNMSLEEKEKGSQTGAIVEWDLPRCLINAPYLDLREPCLSYSISRVLLM